MNEKEQTRHWRANGRCIFCGEPPNGWTEGKDFMLRWCEACEQKYIGAYIERNGPIDHWSHGDDSDYVLRQAEKHARKLLRAHQPLPAGNRYTITNKPPHLGWEGE